MKTRLVDHFRNKKLDELTRQEHELLIDSGVLHEFYPEACGIYNDDVLKTGKEKDSE